MLNTRRRRRKIRSRRRRNKGEKEKEKEGKGNPFLPLKAPYYGCPRHLRNLTDIPWVGELGDPKVILNSDHVIHNNLEM
jgi:hypothetical protein